MSTDNDSNDAQQGTSLLDSQIKTVKVDRRSFLTRAAGAGTLALGAVFTAACGSDDCDTDFGTDSDSGGNADPAGSGRSDNCDSD